jgi:hypothetical protein
MRSVTPPKLHLRHRHPEFVLKPLSNGLSCAWAVDCSRPWPADRSRFESRARSPCAPCRPNGADTTRRLRGGATVGNPLTGRCYFWGKCHPLTIKWLSLQRDSPLPDVLPRGQATGPLSPRRFPDLELSFLLCSYEAWFTPAVSVAVACRGTRGSLRRNRWLGAAARVRLLRKRGDPARHSEAADKRRCLADCAGDHADSWPAATRLAFVPAKPDLELAPSFFLKRHEGARSSKIRRDEGCTRTVFFLSAHPTDQRDGSTDMQRHRFEGPKLVVLGNRASCGSGVGEMASVLPSGARPPVTDML